MFDECENEVRRLDLILEEYMNAHDNNEKDCKYNGVLSTVNGIVVVGSNT